MAGFTANSFTVKNYLKQKIGSNRRIWRLVKIMQGNAFRMNYRKYYKENQPFQTSITEINIEFVNYCNLRCKLCSLDHNKPKIRMQPELLDHFFYELIYDSRFSKVNTIHLYNAGEVLLHPQLKEMLAVIRKYKEEAILKGTAFPKIALLTNATVLTEKHIDILLEANVLDHIRFSMDGGSKEKFEDMRERANWEGFVKNVQHFCERNKQQQHPIPTGIITLIEYDKKMTSAWMSPEFQQLLKTVDGYELRYAHNWGGDVEIDELKNKKVEKTGCSLLMHQLVLLPNGDVTVCCADLNSKGVIGNILNESLFAIYSKPQRLEMLRKMMEGKKSEIDLCKNCESF